MLSSNPCSAALRELEERLATPELRRSPAELADLLADEFREFGGSGRIFDKNQIIEALQVQPPVEIGLNDFQTMSLAPGIVLVTYRGNARFLDTDKVLHSLRSSIWRWRDDRWEIVFHQGTPAADSASR